MSTETTEATETTETTTEETTETRAPIVLTTEQEINALRSVHQFLGNFDRVPGFLSSQWSQALDAIAVVANSLIAKANPQTTTVESAEARIEN